MARSQDLFEKVRSAGEKAIDEFIQTRKSEELFLDFKRSIDRGEGPVLHPNDRNNLAKAISGFGNSEGGILIWGVECSGSTGEDVASAKFPIKNVKRFVSLLEGAVSGLTTPPQSRIENALIQASGEEGFVVTHVPQSNTTPIQAIYNKSFYIRAGSNFELAPYSVLARMFGKRPQPFVFVNYIFGPAKVVGKEIHFQVGFLVHNQGPGIARDIFLNAAVKSSPGTGSKLAFEPTDLKNWGGGWSFGRIMSLICSPDIRLAPESHTQPLVLNAVISPPFSENLEISIGVGCEGAAPFKSSIGNDKEKIKTAYEKFIRLQNSGSITKKDTHQVVEDILKRPHKD